MDSYARHTNDYDEYLDSAGIVRPSWQGVDEKLRTFSEDEFIRRNNLLKRLITDNGITYNVYSKAGNTRKWTMDLLPLVFSQTEWSGLEQKLQQRADIIDKTLTDLYTDQKILQNAILPPFLVYANPSFLRSCYRIKPLGGHFVNLYAADIARSPDGSWWVLNDRIEAASGMGYVLENRMLSNRVFPEFFRDQQVGRLKPFYDDFCDAVSSLNPAEDSKTRVALLTPGPANETYFEQSFLARNMGFQLVEGADLTVRENRLYFKTINGIRPVNTLIRRLDSDWCDPLELRHESLLGVPGIHNCLRSETLAMVNTLGTGLMETVAIPAFLNTLCRHFRGEDLLLPSVATWWCGQPREYNYVMEHLSELVIKRTFRRRNDKAIFGPVLNEEGLANLRKAIETSPEDYCAQEQVSKATAPVYQNGVLQPHHFLIRVYLMRMGDTFRLLPGGLARIAPSPESTSVSMQHGGMSKDVWIVSDKQEQTPEIPASRDKKDSDTLQPALDDISSRTANNMYWLGRYIERIECLARHLRIIIFALIEDFHSDTLRNLRSFISMLLTEEDFHWLMQEPSQQEKMHFLDEALQKYVWDENYISSLAAGFNHLQRIAFNVKDRLSSDTWQILSNMRGISVKNQSQMPNILHEGSIEALEETLEWLSAFSGKTAENMVQSLGWHFLMVGKRLERAHNILEYMRHSIVENPEQEDSHLQLILNYADSTITYRNQYLNNFDKRGVAGLILKNQKNPRSLSFSIERIVAHVSALPWRMDSNESHNKTMQHLRLELIERTNQISLDDLFDGKMESYFKPIEETLNQLHRSIEQRFFAHT